MWPPGTGIPSGCSEEWSSTAGSFRACVPRSRYQSAAASIPALATQTKTTGACARSAWVAITTGHPMTRWRIEWVHGCAACSVPSRSHRCQHGPGRLSPSWRLARPYPVRRPLHRLMSSARSSTAAVTRETRDGAVPSVQAAHRAGRPVLAVHVPAAARPVRWIGLPGWRFRGGLERAQSGWMAWCRTQLRAG